MFNDDDAAHVPEWATSVIVTVRATIVSAFLAIAARVRRSRAWSQRLVG
jgi:hypothetical protein